MKKTFESEILWDDFYMTLLQIHPENYSYDKAFEIVLPYFVKIVNIWAKQSNILSDYIAYFAKDYKKIEGCEKYVNLIFESLIKYDEFKQIALFCCINAEDKTLEETYAYKRVNDDVFILEKHLEFYFKFLRSKYHDDFKVLDRYINIPGLLYDTLAYAFLEKERKTSDMITQSFIISIKEKEEKILKSFEEKYKDKELFLECLY